MTKQLIIQSDKQYAAWIGEVCKRFKQSQIKASIKVNTELLRFYFSLGRDLHAMKEQFGAGNEFYSTASRDLSRALPDVKSFSPTNLKYMQYFFELYGGKSMNISGQQLVDRQHEKNSLNISGLKSTLPSIEEIEVELNGTIKD